MNTRNVEGAVLFADICDSVRMYEHRGNNRGMEIAAQSMERMKRITVGNGGTLLRTQGDGVKSLFDTADRAYDAALKMQAAHRDGLCSIRVAMSYGALLSTRGDVFGDTVHLAVRLLALARPAEILLSGNTAKLLSARHRAEIRLLDTTRLRGKTDPVEIYCINPHEDKLNRTNTLILGASSGHQMPAHRTLVLHHHGGETRYRCNDHFLTIGRAENCDLVVNNGYASRSHARIECQRNGFVIFDQSTNGTYVDNQDDEIVFIKRESLQLLGQGSISLGRPPNYAPNAVIRFQYDDTPNSS